MSDEFERKMIVLMTELFQSQKLVFQQFMSVEIKRTVEQCLQEYSKSVGTSSSDLSDDDDLSDQIDSS